MKRLAYKRCRYDLQQRSYRHRFTVPSPDNGELSGEYEPFRHAGKKV